MLSAALNSSLFLAAAGAIQEGIPVKNPGLGDGVALAVTGMGIVFFSLILLWMLLTVLQKYQAVRGGGQAQAPAPAPAPAVAPAPSPAADPGDIDPEVLAVIMASVMAVVRAPARISRVRFISQPPSPAWSEHGRAQIHTSHRLRKR